ncbi:MAG: GNAT family N-acetyltransferase, partial [Phycisphaeraceae bacterium]|nr:GNAT family N-acetyltransferase [Phycisphaeraceae bacterium]
IWGVYVTPGARGRGLGKAVVARAIEEAKTWEGLARLHLAVSENAPVAKKMYESLGFVQWGYEPDAIRIDGRSFGEHHLEMMVPSSKGSASQ